MKDLIEALQILLKYANDDRDPTHCEHDQLYVGYSLFIKQKKRNYEFNIRNY